MPTLCATSTLRILTKAYPTPAVATTRAHTGHMCSDISRVCCVQKSTHCLCVRTKLVHCTIVQASHLQQLANHASIMKCHQREGGHRRSGPPAGLLSARHIQSHPAAALPLPPTICPLGKQLHTSTQAAQAQRMCRQARAASSCSAALMREEGAVGGRREVCG